MNLRQSENLHSKLINLPGHPKLTLVECILEWIRSSITTIVLCCRKELYFILVAIATLLAAAIDCFVYRFEDRHLRFDCIIA